MHPTRPLLLALTLATSITQAFAQWRPANTLRALAEQAGRPTQVAAPAAAVQPRSADDNQPRYLHNNDVPAPTMRWSNGATSNLELPPEQRLLYPATQAEAPTCSAVLDLGNIAQQNDSGDPRFQRFVQAGRRNCEPLWDLIVTTNPTLNRLPINEAYNRMYVIRDRYTAQVMNHYLGDIGALVQDYEACQRKGLVPAVEQCLHRS